jgi:hypothetical protein
LNWFNVNPDHTQILKTKKKHMWVILCEFLYKSIVHLVCKKKHNEQIWFISIELHVQVGTSLF